MAYSELIKNFDKIRDYMRDFYVYGFKSREQYNRKSTRSYDDEKRRLESWLNDCMYFRQTNDGKTVYISVDTRTTVHNPLYKAWKTASFTDGDITLFFIIFDILYDSSVSLTLSEVVEKIDNDYLSYFSEPKLFDSSTVRKKLREYETIGLIYSEKQGKTLYYKRAEEYNFKNIDVLDFYSEIAPCGVIGSFLSDRQNDKGDRFAFKHHYITQTIDSEILCSLFDSIHKKQEIEITKLNRKNSKIQKINIVPLCVFCSVQSGRQYIMAYRRTTRRIMSFRIDYILSVKPYKTAEDYDLLRSKLDGMMPYMWGVSTQGRGGRRETVEFTVTFDDDEQYIFNRLQREKRCGTVERIDNNNARFFAEVYDTNEMLTWIRSFICRITSLNFSNKEIEKQFKSDIEEMYRMYGVN
ncbi:MAG: WYL domain-containing protein [Clostridia bacterium]|nr:WYL domain-containing protein [Clostridia bacterium]